MATPKKKPEELKRPRNLKDMDNWTEKQKKDYFEKKKAENPGKYRTPEERKKGRPQDFQDPVPTTPENRRRKGPICGANRRGTSTSGPGICCQPAGWGTDHVGVGACKVHGGSVMTHGIKAMKEEVMRKAVMYGAPKEIDPDTAILQELERTAGHIDWLSNIIASMEDKSELMRLTQLGVMKDPFLALYQQEREHLVKVSKVAKDMGIEERRVRLAEDQGKLIAMVLMNFIRDPELKLSPQQQITAKLALRKHLLAIDANSVQIETPKVLDA